MRQVKLSVIMPVLNMEKYVKQTINSILNQSFNDFELIVINDGSTDQTSAIITKFKDKRMKILNNKIHQGVANSLNQAIKLTRGEFIARCDADDLNMKDRFKKQLKFLTKNLDYVLVGTNALIIDQNSQKIGQLTMPEHDKSIKRKLLIKNPILHPSVMIRKTAFKQVGFYNSIFDGVEDYDLWFRLSKRGKFYNIQENLIKRRIHDQVVTKKKHYLIELKALILRFINLPFIYTIS